MKKKSIISALCVLMPLMIWSQTNNTIMEKNQIPQEGRGSSKVARQGRSIDQMVYEFMEKKGIPGLTLAIVQAPYISRIVGYGVSDIEQRRLASSKTIWPAGPISQGFAAVAALQLYEKSKLDLKNKIAEYLENLPQEWHNITVIQLMQHATGIADYRNEPDYDASKNYKPEELISLIANKPLAFTPGQEVTQSATNFLLLAQIIEKVSNMSYHDFITQYQIEHVGLKHTLFTEDLPDLKQEDMAPNHHSHQKFKSDTAYIDPTEKATGYKATENQLQRIPKIQSSALKGFAALWATAEDISTWDIALAGSVLIQKPENRDIIYKPTTLDNGKIIPAMAGWQFPKHAGLMDIKGSVPGFSSYLSRFTIPSELVCVTFMANKEGVDFTNLARQVAAAFNNQLGADTDDNTLFILESVYSVPETIDRIEKELKTLNIPVFARFDHTQNAKEVKLELRPTEIIVFGTPVVGTKLMQANQTIAIELPLRIMAWEDKKGRVWAAFPQTDTLATKYNLQGNPIITKMQVLLEGLVSKATSVY